MKKKDNLIHIKLDYDEAIESRRDILNTEANLIRIVQSIQRYRALRLKELEFKINLYKKIKEFKLDLRKLKTILPKVQVPKILKKHEEEIHREEFPQEVKKVKTKKLKSKKIKKEPKKEKKQIPKDDLEEQLKEIQGKLSKLG